MLCCRSLALMLLGAAVGGASASAVGNTSEARDVSAAVPRSMARGCGSGTASAEAQQAALGPVIMKERIRRRMVDD